MFRHPITQPELNITPGQHQYWGHLRGCSPSLVLAHAVLKHSGPSLLITTSSQQLQQIDTELRFFLANHDLPILRFPDWETLPYDYFSPHDDIISERLAVLARLPQLNRGLLLVTVNTLLQRLAPRDFIASHAFQMRCGEQVNRDQLREQLVHAGYHAVSQVYEHGEFVLRGSVLDLYPMGSDLPYRIDFFDNEIDSIRTFDPDTQRSLAKIKSIDLLPAREFPMTEEGTRQFRQQWRTQFSGDPTHSTIYQDVSHGLLPAGIEYYLPLFFTQTSSLLDYLAPKTLIFRLPKLGPTAEHFYHDVQHRHEQYAHDMRRPILRPHQLYLSPDDLFTQLRDYAQIELQADPAHAKPGNQNFACADLPDVTINSKSQQPLKQLSDFLHTTDTRVLLCAETVGRREVLLNLLHTQGIQPHLIDTWHAFTTNNKIKLGLCVTALERDCVMHEPAITLISETALFGQQLVTRRAQERRMTDPDTLIRNLTELHIGDPIVHIDYGVGRYLGLQTLTIDNIANEFLTLEYANQDKIYVPVANLDLISRYSGIDAEHAPLHHLGSQQWKKEKQKAAQQARDAAVELLDIYAKRAAQSGHTYAIDTPDYQRFSQAFPFEETPDQIQAIQQTLADMQAPKTMDRLICGDVGFGKTEVAMRAAFVAVQGGKQVAVLVPTTLLAQQHYASFQDRFADWPIRVDMLSRFRTKKEQEKTLEDLANGKVDIIIGTHKLLLGKIKFKDLGLLIIDEEHRFGVQQKEQLKKLRANVDILTLTATPIPRTLNLSLTGIRDISIIATPPAKRLAIKTFVQKRNPHIIKEAIQRELLRGGQIYFLHNKVETIQRIADELTALLPDGRIAIAHGQMRERQLERIMADFYHQRINILICTTIIETGIDVPSANTIIIDRADRFGLAQLHQLRGRVGRSHHQAYAYLMTPEPKAMTADAKKRLEAIMSLEDLGAGFTLATHDLEIRGVGEILGEQQSGHIQNVGFQLYQELLERAVNTLKAHAAQKKNTPLEFDLTDTQGLDVNLHISARLPDTYLPDIHTRLILYKRIAHAKDHADLETLQVEMIDRFGLLPEAAKNLFAVANIKLQAKKLGIQKVDVDRSGGRIEFLAKPNIDPMALIQLIQQAPARYKMTGAETLRITATLEDAKMRFECVQQILDRLSQQHHAPHNDAIDQR